MQKNIIKKTCNKCGYYGDFEELITEVGEYFINCNRCGFFEQKMIKSTISNIENVKKTFPIHYEDDIYLTVNKGGFGTWKIKQDSMVNEGSFINEEHISDFLSNIDKILSMDKVIEISYDIKINNEWIHETKKPS